MTPRDERRKRKAPADLATPPVKRLGRKAKKQDDPVWATTNPKSNLVEKDLHTWWSDPATYEDWTREDWEEARGFLPDNAPRAEDGYSVPINYFKYDIDFRRATREYQEDLGAGRYEPEWQRQAAQAMEERAAGKFDSYKEDEYEAFWGQKQKLDHRAIAGDSSKIKLEQLVDGSFLRVGDIFTYRRVFLQQPPGSKVMIEKEVIGISNSKMIIAIPPGQKRGIPHQVAVPNSSKAPVAATSSPDRDISNLGIDKLMAANVKMEPCLKNGVIEPSANGNNSVEVNRGATVSAKMECELTSENYDQITDRVTATGKGNHPETISDQAKDLKMPTSFPAQTDVASTETIDLLSIDSQTGCIHYEPTSVSKLENKILEADGRIAPKDAPIASPWRFFRARRNNQDIGSLFDVREDYFMQNDPQTVKMPRRTGLESTHIDRARSKSTQNNDNARTNADKDDDLKPFSELWAPTLRSQVQGSTAEFSQNPGNRTDRSARKTMTAQSGDTEGDKEMDAGTDVEEAQEVGDSDGDYEVAQPRSRKAGKAIMRSTNQKEKTPSKTKRRARIQSADAEIGEEAMNSAKKEALAQEDSNEYPEPPETRSRRTSRTIKTSEVNRSIKANKATPTGLYVRCPICQASYTLTCSMNRHRKNVGH